MLALFLEGLIPRLRRPRRRLKSAQPPGCDASVTIWKPSQPSHIPRASTAVTPLPAAESFSKLLFLLWTPPQAPLPLCPSFPCQIGPLRISECALPGLQPQLTSTPPNLSAPCSLPSNSGSPCRECGCPALLPPRTCALGSCHGPSQRPRRAPPGVASLPAGPHSVLCAPFPADRHSGGLCSFPPTVPAPQLPYPVPLSAGPTPPRSALRDSGALGRYVCVSCGCV